MTANIDQNATPEDHYLASLENGSLQMTPVCACGKQLNQDYFCETCQRKCSCNLIICTDTATLEIVKRYIRNAPQFSGFKARLADSAY